MSLESLISCRIANRTRFCGEKFCAGGFVSEASEVDAFVVLMRLYSQNDFVLIGVDLHVLSFRDATATYVMSDRHPCFLVVLPSDAESKSNLMCAMLHSIALSVCFAPMFIYSFNTSSRKCVSRERRAQLQHHRFCLMHAVPRHRHRRKTCPLRLRDRLRQVLVRQTFRLRLPRVLTHRYQR